MKDNCHVFVPYQITLTLAGLSADWVINTPGSDLPYIWICLCNFSTPSVTPVPFFVKTTYLTHVNDFTASLIHWEFQVVATVDWKGLYMWLA